MTSISIHQGESPTCRTVRVGELDFLISYETIVAFAVPGHGWCVSENIWSRTTGKHLNQEVGFVDKADRLEHEAFERRLAVVLGTVQASAHAAKRALDILDGRFPAQAPLSDVEAFLASA